MRVSFNGVILPYTYNCPHAHKLKNIDRVVIPPREDVPEEEISKRKRGIELHDSLAEYMKGETEEFPFLTDTIKRLQEERDKIIEQEEYYDLDLKGLPSKPTEGDYISCRKDLQVIYDDKIEIVDWKFGNPDFGISRHLDELEFFLALESATSPEVGKWIITIHFPETDYTVPTKPYSYNQVARLQQKYLRRIDIILNDKYCKASPSRMNCKFCSYRSYDTFGSGDCEFSVI